MSFYFDFRSYFKVVRRVLTDSPRPKRLVVHLMLLFLLSWWALFNAICMELDRIVFFRYRKTQIKNPVFIVGNARSGTTLFQRILSGDDEQFVDFKGWEVVFPSLIQRKAIRVLTTILKRIIPRLEERYVRFEEGRLKEIAKMRPVGLTKNEEDEMLFIISFGSSAIVMLFPYLDDLMYLTAFDEQVPEKTRKRSMRFYRECVLRHVYFHGSDRTLVSKNPSFVMKMRSLAEEFPDAKFVYMMRNPFETIPSLLDLLSQVWKRLGMDMESDHIRKTIKDLYECLVHDYKYAMEVLSEWPEDRYAVVEYQELTADPKAMVEKVYEKLNIPISPAFDKKLDAERARQKKYHSSHAYTLQDFGLTERQIHEELAGIIDRYGYRLEDVPEDETKEML